MAANSIAVNTDDAAAAQAAERAAQAAASQAQRPEGLPEKFTSVADMAKSYAELERKLGSGTPAQPTITPAIQSGDAAGMETFAGELLQKGTLSEASKKALTAKGLSEADVGVYADGLRAKAASNRAQLAAVAGGDAALKNVYEWAQTNLSQEDLSTYNALIESGNIPAAKLSLQAIVSRYTAAMGSEPAFLDGEASSVAGIRPFASSAEVVKAMSDPRYENDPAYRKQVERRVGLTQMNVRGK